MRRKEKQLNDISEIEAVIARALVCRLAMVDGDTPYLVPMSFGYRDGTFYFHSASEGKKIDLLTQNPRVCLELETDVQLSKAETPCKWGMRFKSVIGLGIAMFVTDSAEKRRALEIIMEHYGDETDGSDGSFAFSESVIEKTTIFKVVPAEMTGKQS